jgi:hypothetical protein
MSVVNFDPKRLQFLEKAFDVDSAITIIHLLLKRNKVIIVKRGELSTINDAGRFHRFLRTNFRTETRGEYWIVYQPSNRWFG